MISEFLSYGFVQRGLLAGSLAAAICAILGVFLVLKRLSLIGDGLSHVCLTGVAAALLLGASPVYVSIPVVMVSSVGILKLAEKFRIYGDAAIGIVSAAGLAVGLFITALAGGFNTDLLGYLFGSILTVGWDEAVLCAVLLAILLFFLTLFLPGFVSASFDAPFAHTRGINVQAMDLTLTLITSAAVVLTFKVVGIFLISALLIIPPVAALMLARTFKQVLVWAVVLAVLAVWAGVFLSFLFDIPSGATIILVNLAFLAAAYAWNRLRSRYAR